MENTALIFNLYCIRDSKTCWINPICDHNDESAKRNFAYFMHNDANASICPQDFDMFIVGTFDSGTGEIVPCIPRLVCSGTDFCKRSVID